MIVRINQPQTASRRLRLRPVSEPVVSDVETTGLGTRNDRILSLGMSVGEEAFIFFTDRCTHHTIRPHITPDSQIAEVMAAVNMPGRILVGHNFKYDLAMLRHEGYGFDGEIRDTQVMLRQLDPQRLLRRDLRSRKMLNNRLKDATAQLCNIEPQFTPDRTMLLVPFTEHATYLAHDLICTQALHDNVWSRMTPAQQERYQTVESPLQHRLLDLSLAGVHVGTDFLRDEPARIDALMARVDQEHRLIIGAAIPTQNQDLIATIYQKYGAIPPAPNEWPIDRETLERYAKITADAKIARSIELIVEFRRLRWLANEIRSMREYEDGGKFYAQFDNHMVSGRIGAKEPNLQGVPKVTTITVWNEPHEITPRQMIVPPPGCLLVAADISQADVRVVAREIACCKETIDELMHRLSQRRLARMPHLQQHEEALPQFRNPDWTGRAPDPPPEFDPNGRKPLVETICSDGDFYTRVAKTVAGDQETIDRSRWKTILLGTINGQTPTGFSKALGCSVEEAKAYEKRFFDTFPDLRWWIEQRKIELAITGELSTWAGRSRLNAAQKWIATEARVRVLLTYADGNRYWFTITPVRVSRWNVTAYCHQIVSVRNRHHPLLIYEVGQGRTGSFHYPQIDESGIHLLPYRKLPWRSIRRVIKLGADGEPSEDCPYEGFDQTAKSAINTIMQGGTADVIIGMMLRVRPLERAFGAKLILQIHDELIWEVPQGRLAEFVDRLRPLLQEPPDPMWRVPIVVDVKVGPNFGNLTLY